MQGSKETKTLPYRPGPLSGFVKLNAADAGGRGPDCPAPNRDRTGHVWRRGLPHSLARAGKRGLPHVCCRTATATRSTAFGSRTPCRVVRAEPIRRAKSFPCRIILRTKELTMGRYLLLWLLGIPLPILALIWIFGGLH